MGKRKQNWGYYPCRDTNAVLYRVCTKIETFLNEEDFLDAVKRAMDDKCDFEVAFAYDENDNGKNYRETDYPLLPRACYEESDYSEFELWYIYNVDNSKKGMTFNILYAKVVPENELTEKEKAYNFEYYVN